MVPSDVWYYALFFGEKIMSDQKSLRDLKETAPMPLHPDEIEPLLRQLWEFILEQRTFVYVPWALPEVHQHDAGRDDAFCKVLAFIKGAADSNTDGDLRDVDDPVRTIAVLDAEKGFKYE